MAKKSATGTPAITVLTEHGVVHTVHSYEVSPDAPHYGALVARALLVEPESVFKTLIADVDGDLVVAVVPVTGDLDLKVAGEFTGGCADSGFTSGVGTPTVCAVGPVGGKAHTPEEFLVVDSIVPRAQTLALAVARLA